LNFTISLCIVCHVLNLPKIVQKFQKLLIICPNYKSFFPQSLSKKNKVSNSFDQREKEKLVIFFLNCFFQFWKFSPQNLHFLQRKKRNRKKYENSKYSEISSFERKWFQIEKEIFSRFSFWCSFQKFPISDSSNLRTAGKSFYFFCKNLLVRNPADWIDFCRKKNHQNGKIDFKNEK